MQRKEEEITVRMEGTIIVMMHFNTDQKEGRMGGKVLLRYETGFMPVKYETIITK